MPEIFNDVEEDAFALPGDEARLAQMAGAAGAEAPEPATPEESEPAAAGPAAAAEPVEPAAAAPAPADAPGGAQEVADALQVDVDDPEVQAYLEKFGGDPAKALKAAVNAQALLGRQGQELGELRRIVEERLPEPEPAPQPQYDQDALEVWFAEHPTQIPELAARAYLEGNEQVLNTAIAAWEDVDRGAARAFERKIAVAEARRELSAESEQRNQIVDEWSDAAEKFAEAHPDLEQVAPKMRELAPQFPNMIQILRTGDPGSKLEVLEFLYDKARGQSADTLVTSARSIAREQAREAEEAIAGAAVASASSVVAGIEPSKAEQIAREWETADAPYRDGWNV